MVWLERERLPGTAWFTRMNLNRRAFLAALTCAPILRQTGLPGFTAGTSGKFVDFGKGTTAMLHCPEAIVPKSKIITGTLRSTFCLDSPEYSRAIRQLEVG